jgi:hypothetical protein
MSRNGNIEDAAAMLGDKLSAAQDTEHHYANRHKQDCVFRPRFLNILVALEIFYK